VHVDELIEENPNAAAFDTAALADAIKACFACEESCSACADACLSEPSPAEMARCIRLDLLCADVCGATGRALSRQGTPPEAVTRLVDACRAICELCRTECAQHDEEHCRLCADACGACAHACEELLASRAA
jgi:hypothetical protein